MYSNCSPAYLKAIRNHRNSMNLPRNEPNRHPVLNIGVKADWLLLILVHAGSFELQEIFLVLLVI